MPQLNRKYPSGAAKRRKKERKIKTDEKCEGLLDRFVVVASGTSDPTEESAASSTQVVYSSYVCLVHKQMCHTQKLNFCNSEVDKYMLLNIHIFIQGFLSYVTELKRLDKFLTCCDVVPKWTSPSENKTTCNCCSRYHTTSFNL